MQTDSPGWIHFLNIFVLSIIWQVGQCKGTFWEMTFPKGQRNVGEFRTVVIVNVILNTKKVGEMSGNFILFAYDSCVLFWRVNNHTTLRILFSGHSSYPHCSLFPSLIRTRGQVKETNRWQKKDKAIAITRLKHILKNTCILYNVVISDWI